MEKQVELDDQVNFVVDFVLLHFQKRIDVDPKINKKNFFSK
jgi:hypothetical protein